MIEQINQKKLIEIIRYNRDKITEFDGMIKEKKAEMKRHKLACDRVRLFDLPELEDKKTDTELALKKCQDKYTMEFEKHTHRETPQELLAIIKRTAEIYQIDAIPYTQLNEMYENKTELKENLEKLKRNGDIFEPKKDYIQII